MAENFNNETAQKQNTLDSLDKSSESFTDSLEKIEANLKINDDNIKVSDDLRAAYLKINSLNRSNGENTQLQSEYSNILKKYDELGNRGYESQKEYTEASRDLLKDLGNLSTTSGEKLSDKNIDGGLFEAGVALKDGVIKAGEKIYEELKGYFDMLGVAGDLGSIMEKIMSSLSFETFSNIYNELVDMGGDIIRDFNLILKNSTGLGKTVELSHFIPSVGIPLLFDSIGPGKFFKILKIEKYIPEHILKGVGEIYEKGKKAVDKVTKVGDKAEKIEEKVDKVEKTTKGFDSSTIRDNFSITDNETRKIAAIDTLKQKYPDFEGFTPEQLNGIIEAHEIGKDLFKNYLEKHSLNSVEQLTDKQLKEIFDSPEGRIALRQKMKKLKEVGIDQKYSDDLIRSGITGGEIDNIGMKIVSKEELTSMQKPVENILSNMSKLPSMISKIVDRTLSPEDLQLLNDIDEIARKGFLSSNDGFNKAMLEVIAKAKLGEKHPAMEKIFTDFNSGKIKLNKLEAIKSGDISNIPGYGLANDLLSRVNKLFSDVKFDEVLESVSGVLQVSAGDFAKLGEVMGNILKIDFKSLLSAAINLDTIKPFEFILKYGGFMDPKVSHKVSIIIREIKSGEQISKEDIDYLLKVGETLKYDDRLIDISKGKLDKAKIALKKDINSSHINIPEEKITKFGAFGTIPEVQSGIQELVLDGNVGIKNLLEAGNKSVLDKLLSIKDQLWDNVSDVNGLKKELHNNKERKSLLESLGLGNDEIDLLDNACLI